jgi:CheY-like chemotaxis protein
MNAVKFTEQGGVTLSISLSKTTDEGKEAKFMISDTGIGITDQGMEQLFKNFSQVDSSVSRLYGGTGLGLSISQKLVRLMGGYITVESIPAKGSTFSFVLPFTIAPSKSTVSTEASSEKTAASAPGKQFPLNILVAEDNKVNQQVIELMLHRLGYEMVVMAHNGQEVLHALEMDRFDLILMDIQMPVMNAPR